MRRTAILLLLVAVALAVIPVQPSGALSVPNPPRPRQLTVSGFVIGRVAKGNLIRFGILAIDPVNWAHLHSVKVALLLRGQSLLDMAFFVKQRRFKLGDRPAVDTTNSAPVSAGFLQINPHTVRMIRHTFSVRVTFWARVREPIPRGTTFRVIARDEEGNISYARERVSVGGGFLTWGTFGIGFVLALLIGAFLTHLRYSERIRDRRPSVWEIIERRLREERARPPVLVGAGGNGGLG